jgi:hypothetical protein
MSDYDPKEYLVELGEALLEAEDYLEDPHLPPEDRVRFQRQRKSIMTEMAKVRAEMAAIVRNELFGESTQVALSEVDVQNHVEYRQAVLSWTDAQRETRGACLRVRYELIQRMTDSGKAPGQVKENRSRPPNHENAADLCLFNAAFGWTIEDTIQHLVLLGCNRLLLDGHTWEKYDSCKIMARDNPKGESLNADSIGLRSQPDIRDYDALVDYGLRNGFPHERVRALLHAEGATLDATKGWNLTWKMIREAMVEIEASEILGDKMVRKKSDAQPAPVTVVEEESDLFAASDLFAGGDEVEQPAMSATLRNIAEEAAGDATAEDYRKVVEWAKETHELTPGDVAELWASVHAKHEGPMFTHVNLGTLRQDIEFEKIRRAMGVRERWKPTTEKDFTWLVGLINQIAASEAILDQQYREMKSELERRGEALLIGFKSELETWSADNLDPGKKSRKLLTGTIQWTSRKAGYVIGEKELLLGHLARLTQERQLALKVEKYSAYRYTDLDLLKQAAAEDLQVTGEVWPGLKYQEASDTMTIKGLK